MEDIARQMGRTAEIIAAYVSKNPLPASELASLIKTVHASLSQSAVVVNDPTTEMKAPSVSIKKSVTPDYLICLEDGLKFKSLKRHLRSKYGMTAEDYRAKWRLPKNYPMVAPAYSASRSALAKEMKLGQKRVPESKAKSAPRSKVPNVQATKDA
ncbi:MucR family transcriptional regulator [Asticcacaulis sp. EMRT-3]|uniref:MucR family transcriptional regulator n=1 Tax=Asticcacaulis sp. EMRT-3 TaxID=3040349 RepID=UPI0024AFC306|nr:MucR family transcriptional regulator [Asticcacaulis sp. EMRT-3]MDI7776601.1 MucR family transcriptional regulator [Asticcacaulis sp. EMRT-3]